MSTFQSNQPKRMAEMVFLSTLALFPSGGCTTSSTTSSSQGGAEVEKSNAELLEKNEDVGAKPNTPPDQTEKELSQKEVIGKGTALYGAMNGPGTDEATVFKTLASLDKAGQDKVAQFYKNRYGETLDDALKGDLNATQLALATKLREGTSPGTADAVQIYVAVNRYGTAKDSEALKNIMMNKTPDEISGIASRYQQLIGSPLESDLKDWLSKVRTEQEDVLAGLRGPTYELHELIDSGRAMTKDGLPTFQKLMNDPNTIAEYERWYGKSPAAVALATPAERGLSSSMTMKEIYFAYGTDLTISDSAGQIGTVEQRTLNFTPCFEYRDNKGKLLAYTRQRVISVGTHIDIFDSEGTKIGALRDKVFSNLFSISRAFSLEDANGNEIGTSRKVDFFATTVEIYTPDRKVLASIRRPAIDIGLDDWTIDIPGDIDKRLVVFIPAYKTHSDNQKAE